MRLKPLCEFKLHALQFARSQPQQPILAAFSVEANRYRQASVLHMVNGEHERTQAHTQASRRSFDD